MMRSTSCRTSSRDRRPCWRRGRRCPWRRASQCWPSPWPRRTWHRRSYCPSGCLYLYPSYHLMYSRFTWIGQVPWTEDQFFIIEWCIKILSIV